MSLCYVYPVSGSWGRSHHSIDGPKSGQSEGGARVTWPTSQWTRLANHRTLCRVGVDLNQEQVKGGPPWLLRNWPDSQIYSGSTN